MEIDLRLFVFRVVCRMNILDMQVVFTVRKLLTSTILLAAISFSGKIFALQEGNGPTTLIWSGLKWDEVTLQ